MSLKVTLDLLPKEPFAQQHVEASKFFKRGSLSARLLVRNSRTNWSGD